MSIGGQQMTTSMLATSTPPETTEFVGRRSGVASRSGLTRALVSHSTAAARRSDSVEAMPGTTSPSSGTLSTGLATAIRRCNEQGTVSTKSATIRSNSGTVSTGNRVAETEVVTLLLVTDRRRSTRHSCDKPVAVRLLNALGQPVSNRMIPARMVDVAATGIAILCSEAVGIGQRLSVEFQPVVDVDREDDGSSQSQTRSVLTGAVLRSEMIEAGKSDRRIVFVPDRPLTTAQIASLGTDLFAGTIV